MKTKWDSFSYFSGLYARGGYSKITYGKKYSRKSRASGCRAAKKSKHSCPISHLTVTEHGSGTIRLEQNGKVYLANFSSFKEHYYKQWKKIKYNPGYLNLDRFNREGIEDRLAKYGVKGELKEIHLLKYVIDLLMLIEKEKFAKTHLIIKSILIFAHNQGLPNPIRIYRELMAEERAEERKKLKQKAIEIIEKEKLANKKLARTNQTKKSKK